MFEPLKSPSRLEDVYQNGDYVYDQHHQEHHIKHLPYCEVKDNSSKTLVSEENQIGFTVMWFIFLYFCVRLIIYITVFGILLASSYGSYVFMSAGQEDTLSYAIGITLISITACILFCAWCCAANLEKVIDVCEDTCLTLLTLPYTFLVPWFSLPILVLVFGLWSVANQLLFVEEGGITWGEESIDALLTTQGVPYLYDDADTTYWTYDMNNSTPTWKMWLILFLMFWCVKFIEYWNFMVIAGCVSDFYLDMQLGEGFGDGMAASCWTCFCGIFFGWTNLCASMWRVFRYHMEFTNLEQENEIELPELCEESDSVSDDENLRNENLTEVQLLQQRKTVQNLIEQQRNQNFGDSRLNLRGEIPWIRLYG